MKTALIIVVVVLIAAVVCYLTLFPRNTFITYSTPGGKSVTFSRTSASLDPMPDRYPTNGFHHVESYMSRLQRSHKTKAGVIIATFDGQHALLVMRYEGQTVLSVSADRTKNTGEEARMLQFFSELGMTPIRDYLSANGGVPNAVRHCGYALSNDPAVISRLCISLFTNLFGVTDDHGIEFIAHGLPRD